MQPSSLTITICVEPGPHTTPIDLINSVLEQQEENDWLTVISASVSDPQNDRVIVERS